MKSLNPNILNLKGQKMFQILQDTEKKLNNKKLLHFELGQSSLKPSNIIRKNLYSFAKSNFYPYTNSKGDNRFITSIINHYKIFKKININVNNILITPSANSVIYFLIKTICQKNDNIILVEPSFPTYLSAAQSLGVKIKSYQTSITNNFEFDTDDILSLVDNKTKLFIINSPSNPTGKVYDSKKILKLINELSKLGIYVLSDEVYTNIIFDQKINYIHTYGNSRNLNKNLIILESLSKIFSIPGMRLGYCTGPSNIIKKMQLLVETTVSCIPQIFQNIGSNLLRDFTFAKRKKIIDQYHIRRNLIYSGLNNVNGLKIFRPNGAFYLFINTDELGINGNQFFKILLNKLDLVIAPGEIFGNHYKNYARISFGSKIDELKILVKKINTEFN